MSAPRNNRVALLNQFSRIVCSHRIGRAGADRRHNRSVLADTFRKVVAGHARIDAFVPFDLQTNGTNENDESFARARVNEHGTKRVVRLEETTDIALGVTCAHCHVVTDFASDEKRPKKAAREMQVLHKSINEQLRTLQHLNIDADKRSIN